jgi:hypothetical protein
VDVYSFAIILWQMATCSEYPEFEGVLTSLSMLLTAVIRITECELQVQHKKVRPSLKKSCMELDHLKKVLNQRTRFINNLISVVGKMLG